MNMNTTYRQFHRIIDSMTVQQGEESPLWILGYGSLIFKPPPHASTPIPGLIKGYVRRFWQSSSDHRGTPERKGRVATLISHDDVLNNEDILRDVLKYRASNVSGDDNSDDLEKDHLTVQCCVYYIPPEKAAQVREYLDIREQDGYTLHTVDFLVSLEDLLTLDEHPHPHHLHLKHGSALDPEILKQLALFPLNEQGQRVLPCKVYIGTTANESFVGPESTSKTASVIAMSHGPSGQNREYLEELVKALRTLGEEDQYLEELLRKVLLQH